MYCHINIQKLQKKFTFKALTITSALYFLIFLANISFKFIHLQLCIHYKFFIQWKKSYQLLACRVFENPPALKLLNYFTKSRTVAYKQVAIKKVKKLLWQYNVNYYASIISYQISCLNFLYVSLVLYVFFYIVVRIYGNRQLIWVI